MTPFFDRVLSSGDQRTPRWQIKVDLIKLDQPTVPGAGVVVGDTETDILAGKALGLRTVAVLNGIRTEDFIKEVGPDLIISGLGEIPAWIETTREGREYRRLTKPVASQG